MGSKVSKLHSRARALFAKFEQGERTSCIDEAIILGREALVLCPPGHRKRAIALTLLGTLLQGRYVQLGATRDLDEAIVLNREALKLQPRGHPDCFVSLNNLAVHLSTRYSQLGFIQDLDEAIVFGREALNLVPKGHLGRSASLNNLAVILFTRYNRLGVIQNLQEAIVLHREALDLVPEGHPDRSTSLNNLAVDFSTRYKQLGVFWDLEEAIVLGREVLHLRPKGHPGRSMSLTNLTVRLSTRYDRLGIIHDLEEAVVLGQEALDLLPKGHHDRSTVLSNLAVVLSTQYNLHGVIQDLEKAIVLEREALDLLSRGHSDRSMSLSNLAVCLSTRYNQLGVLQDLEEAVSLNREALRIRQTGHPDRSTSLNNLADRLSTRYQQFGTMQDLEEAIDLSREALNLRPKGHPNRSTSLNNLTICLSVRYDQLGVIQDLEEAIVLSREALDLRPKGHPDRSVSLINLSVRLSTRYSQLGVVQDLEEAIFLGREALNLRPNGHPDRSTSLTSLASRLFIRYNQFGVIEDLEEAIALGREALDLRPQGHPSRSKSLDSLAGHLRTRFSRSRQLQDKEELFGLYTQLTCVDQFVSSADISAARAWTCVAEDLPHPSLLLAYETALRLLIQHLATLPSLPQHHTVFKHLTSSLAVDAFSACLRHHAPAHAVELLEQGRSVFWSQLTRLHSPLQDVIKSGPAGKILVDQFTRLTTDMRSAFNVSRIDQHERLWKLNLEIQEIVKNIRKLPGLSRFLLPPLFSDLQRAAVGGPIIILNASKYSCDALIVFFDHDPVHISLQITREIVRDLSAELHTLTEHARKEDMSRGLGRFLREIWDRIVCPVIDVLQMILPSQSRIWWCPTAEFSLLPLHAVGPYRKGQRNLADLYISSYTPTLSALIRSRRHNQLASDGAETHFVAIGQAQAKGESELICVGTELNNVAQHVEGITTFTRVDGIESSVGRVVEELGRNEWVHLACHGIPNPTRPFESAFALRDGHFTIRQIIGCELKNAEFAYLSACHTTVGDEESPDEAIHLASAMQFIGFRSVIGTMWAVDDGETNKITSTFYRYMVDDSGRLDYTRAAFALNKMMKSVNVRFDQRILYVHLGA